MKKRLIKTTGPKKHKPRNNLGAQPKTSIRSLSFPPPTYNGFHAAARTEQCGERSGGCRGLFIGGEGVEVLRSRGGRRSAPVRVCTACTTFYVLHNFCRYNIYIAVCLFVPSAHSSFHERRAKPRVCSCFISFLLLFCHQML